MWNFISKQSDLFLAEFFHFNLGVIICLLPVGQQFVVANPMVRKLSVDTVIRRARGKGHSTN